MKMKMNKNMKKFKLTKGWRQNHRASGGFHFINRKLDREIFIDYGGDARIAKTHAGHWDKSVQVKDEESFEEIVKRLLTKSKVKRKVKYSDITLKAEEFEILLAEVIDELYIKYKKDFCDYKNKTHKLGWFKESVKSEIYRRLKQL